MPKISPRAHIIVGMSGGVDSSVCAYLLKKAGHLVEGVFMKNWEADDTSDFCSSAFDLADAKNVCDVLNIDFHSINFADTYWAQVFTHFLDEYRLGRTPNPDILCNKEIKFKAFLNYALNRGADYIATGHYVRRLQKDNKHYLCKGKDANKDQSYFLYALSESQLAHSIFPIGELKKSAVRAIAADIGLINHAKKDSTGICFIGERKFKTFLNAYLPASSGKIETADGHEIGEHAGLMFYTIGQRQGLGIGGRKNASGAAWYVAAKDVKRNVLTVVQGSDHPLLFKNVLHLDALHWINANPSLPRKLLAKTRYRQSDQVCVLAPGMGTTNFEVTFETPQRAITPGQSIVFYEGDICLGGGIIEN